VVHVADVLVKRDLAVAILVDVVHGLLRAVFKRVFRPTEKIHALPANSG
jgi:hypothetical protein